MNQSDLWAPRRRVELAFRRALRHISRMVSKAISMHDSIEDIQKALLEMTFSKDFIRACESAAMKMVTGLFADQGRTWREAAAANGMGRKVYEALRKELEGPTGARVRELVFENSRLIKTLPNDISDMVTKFAARESFKGRRASDIAKQIQAIFPEHTRARADLIARTQVSMTQTNLIKARSEKFGWNWYVWRAVGGGRGDGRTRKSHRGMSGVLVNWNDPPAPEDLFPTYTKSGRPYRNTLGKYHAGQCPNCRCYPEPVIDLDLFQWPMRVYRNGSIRSMSRKQFEGIL